MRPLAASAPASFSGECRGLVVAPGQGPGEGAAAGQTFAAGATMFNILRCRIRQSWPVSIGFLEAS